MALSEAANVNFYIRGTYDYFIADRYRLQRYLANATAITLDGMSPSARTPTENATWTHACQVSLAYKTLKSR